VIVGVRMCEAGESWIFGLVVRSPSRVRHGPGASLAQRPVCHRVASATQYGSSSHLSLTPNGLLSLSSFFALHDPSTSRCFRCRGACCLRLLAVAFLQPLCFFVESNASSLGALTEVRYMDWFTLPPGSVSSRLITA
jgi:hypothetical protein